ncbi:unnamed protein product [Prunus brigantina]
MPYSVYLQLGLGELKATTISLQLADRSVKYPRGIVEDILVQVDKLILPADFVVLDMEEAPIHDRELPILLGRPFMATAKTIIDVQNGLLTMTVLGETVQFKVFESLSHPSSSFDCCSIDVLDSIVFSKFLLAQSNDPLQYVLMLQRCRETNLILNWEKCQFMVKRGVVLGHVISSKGIEVDKAKIDIISNMAAPASVKGVRSFLGHAGFYRRFIKDFSKITRPLCNLLAKDVVFHFDKDCVNAFNILKRELTSAPIIMAPDWSLPFELMCDASTMLLVLF